MMRYLLILFVVLVLLLSTNHINAIEREKDETLVTGKYEFGGFGGPVFKFSTLADEFAFLVGGRGGWIINHAISLGGGGYGLAQETVFEGIPGSPYMQFGYGGGIIEFIYRSDKLIHVSLAGLIGGGGFGYAYRDWGYYQEDIDAFFVMEPELNVMMNITEFFRIGAGGSYRYVTGITIENYTNSDLSGFSGNITLKFGLF
jgi:hypothetical protein